ncbi:putative polysaccharide biosynthesis protein [Halothermothrix orenii]|uniref:Polysaccharide biosynthesis protein n=1 Tax=Halothermothrix orenii (strain H 168 / OCM 544 / DSM 9562) TaxID=373903 RepID=B8D011_HALOH|nr:polysaccharide biosynthesis protein [Halothermothrix orenii]ACL70863.1 polysaccharide biosynthesis protein [Halothermothrix orenii H 168]
MVEDKGKNFIKGAVILSAAGLISKVMGFVYRVILTRIIGAEGMGLYQMAYPIYTTLLVVSRSGIPVSLAKLISGKIARGQKNDALKTFKVGRSLSILIGLFFSILMMVLARPLVNILEWDSRAYYAVLAISPAIFFVSIMATYRGFFQGLQNMKPTAYSQVIEQWVRMVTMISLVYFLVPYGLGIAAAGATSGAVTGSMAGLLTLIYIYYKKKKEIWNGISIKTTYADAVRITGEIARLGIPITFAALVQPLMTLVDTVIVPQRLQVAGYAVEKATELFGQLSGVAMVLVNFPTIITISLAASLVPSISEAYALKRHDLIDRRTRTALRLTVLIGLPAAVGLFILARPLTGVIFGEADAAIPLRIVGWGVIFIAIQQTTSAILQGLGQTAIPARNLLTGAVVNALINYSLTASPRFGIKGAALGTVTGFAVAALLNLISVKKFTGFKIKIKELIFKPVLAVFLMAVAVNRGFVILLNLLEGITDYNYHIATFFIVFFAVIIYLFFLLLFNEIRYSDVAMIPGYGKKIADKLKKIGLLGD